MLRSASWALAATCTAKPCSSISVSPPSRRSGPRPRPAAPGRRFPSDGPSFPPATSRTWRNAARAMQRSHFSQIVSDMANDGLSSRNDACRAKIRPMATEIAVRHGQPRTAVEITPEVLLKAYACGIFPMAESADDPALYWIEPEERGIIPLDAFHIPSRLARTVRSERFSGPRQPRLRRACSTAAPSPRPAAPGPGSMRASARSTASSTTSAIATASRPTRTDGWSAASTACASAARSSARACSTSRATPRRWRWCISSRD